MNKGNEISESPVDPEIDDRHVKMEFRYFPNVMKLDAHQAACEHHFSEYHDIDRICDWEQSDSLFQNELQMMLES